ncbi:hypothetical protein Tco_0247883 [Tanacetum coccineum]
MENMEWLIELCVKYKENQHPLHVWIGYLYLKPNTVLKKDTITSAPVSVKIHQVPIVAFPDIWPISSEAELKDSLVVAIPFPNRKGHSLETIKTEYEWQPPRYDTCKLFDHWDDDCPKRVKVVEPTVPSYVNDNDGFTQVIRKHGKAKQDGKGKQPPKPLAIVFDEGINLVTLRNLFDSLMERDKKLKKFSMRKNVGKQRLIKGQALPLIRLLMYNLASWNIRGLCVKVFKKWQWTSNVLMCTKGSPIILGWDPDVVNVIVISCDAQVMPWCLLRDFKVSLHADEKSTGSLSINTGMRDFQECMDDIEMSDVNNMGLRFTWNQKPKGDNGVLKKIDQIIANLAFYTSFVGSSAIFQPYRILDHSSAILRVPMLSLTKPHPFKFSYILHPLRKLLYDHGNLHENVKKLCHELDTIQIALDKDPNNIDLREEEAAYLLAFNDASLLEEKFLMQKARVEWLKLGDANTAYFNKVLSNDIANYMVREVSDQEIHDAIFDMGDNKAPGPDGYTTTFFKEAWDIISNDVVKEIKEFFTNRGLPKELNHTILALISKIEKPICLRTSKSQV